MKIVQFRGTNYHFPDETPDEAITAEMARIGDAEAGVLESAARLPRDIASGYQRGLVGVAALTRPFTDLDRPDPAYAQRMRGPLGLDVVANATDPNNIDLGYGKRPDGSFKGNGFLGPLRRPDGEVSTELSIGVNIDGKEVEIPSLVPTLTKEEIQHLLADGEPTEAIIQKAVEHAFKRIDEGKSPFAQPDESPSESRLVQYLRQRRDLQINSIEAAKEQAKAEANAPLDLFAAQKEIAEESESATDKSGFSRPLISGVARSVGQMVPVVVAGAAPGVGFPAAVGLGMTQQGTGAYEDAFRRYRAAGMNDGEADRRATQDAVISGAITGAATLGFGPAANRVFNTRFTGGLERIFSKQSLASAVAEEAGEELTDEGSQMMWEIARSNPNMTGKEVFERLVQAGIGGAVGAGIFKSGAKGLQAVAKKLQQPEAVQVDPKTKKTAAAVNEMVANAAGNNPAAAGVVAGMNGSLSELDVDAAMASLPAGLEENTNISADTTGGQAPGPVMPDAPETINAQINDALNPESTRAAVLITPREDGWFPDIDEGPAGDLAITETPHGVVLYNPDKVTAEQVEAAGAGENFDGRLLGMSTADRPAGGQKPEGLVVTTKSADGTADVLSQQVASPAEIPAAVAAGKAASPGGESTITTNEELLRGRVLADEAAELARQRGDGLKAEAIPSPSESPAPLAPQNQPTDLSSPTPPSPVQAEASGAVPSNPPVAVEAPSIPGAPQETPAQPAFAAQGSATVSESQIQEAVDRSDIGGHNVDIVASDAPYDVAYDPATKRFLVNPNKVTSAAAVTMKLNTHEKLHFVIDALRDAGRAEEASGLIDIMAAMAPDALVEQIQKYYAGSTDGTLTEEQAAYASQQFAKHFAKKGWFHRLTAMVSKILSQVTGDKAKASKVAAELAASRIHGLSQEFLAKRRAGETTPGELKMSRPEVDVALGVPTQRFGETEVDVRHDRAVFANIAQRLAPNYLSLDSPITPENTTKFWAIADGLSDPESGRAFADQINRDAGGQPAAANLMQATLKAYAFRYLGQTGDGSLDRFMQESAMLMQPGTAKNNTEVGQMLRALQYGMTGGSPRVIAGQQIEEAMKWVETHKDPSGKVPIGGELLERLIKRLARPLTFEEISVDPEKGSKVYEALKKLMVVHRRIRQPGDPNPRLRPMGRFQQMPRWGERGQGQGGGQSPQGEQKPERIKVDPANKIVKAWIDRIEKEQTELLKPDPKKNAVTERLRTALKNKDNMTPQGALFRSELETDLVNLGVDAALANQVAFDIHMKRMARFASRRAAQMERVGEGELRQSDVSFLIHEIMANPVQAQNSPAWRMETAMNYYLRRGLSREQAEAATRLFEFVFRNQLADAQYAAAEKVVRESVDVDGNMKLDSLPKIRRALRSQIANPDAPFAEALATEYGWKSPFTKKQYDELAQIDAAMNHVTRHEQAILVRRAARILRESTLAPTKREKLAAYYIINALSGIPTILVNATGGLVDAATLVATETARSVFSGEPVARLGQVYNGLISALNAYRKEIAFSSRRDAYVNLDYQEITRFNALADLTQNALRDLRNPALTGTEKLNTTANGLLGLVDVFRRTLSTFDNSISAGIRDFTETIGVRDGYRGTGMDSTRAYALATAAHALAPDFIREGQLQGFTGNRLSMYVDDRIRDTMLARAREAGVDADSVTQEAKDILELATGNFSGARDAQTAFDRGTVFGQMAEAIVGGLEHITREFPLVGRMILGFLRVPFNRTNYAFNYSGAGLLRLAYRYAVLKAGGADPYEKSMRTSFQRKFIATQGLIGLAMWGAVGALLKDALSGDKDDDEEWVIDATAGRIPSENDRKLMMAVGLNPNAANLFMRNKRTGEVRRLQTNRGMLDSFSWQIMAFGAIRDVQRLGKLKDELSAEDVGKLAGQMLLGAAQITRTFGVGNVADLGDKLSTAKGAAGTAGFMASGFMPAGSFVNSVRRIAEDKPSRETVSTAFWSSFAFAPPDARKPALNWLGHPVQGEYSGIGQRIADRATDLAFPLGVRLPQDSPSWRIYKVMLEKGATPIGSHITDLERKVGRPITPDEWYNYVKTRGGKIESMISQRLPALEKLPTEQFDKAVDAISRIATKETEAQMFKIVPGTKKPAPPKRELIAQ